MAVEEQLLEEVMQTQHSVGMEDAQVFNELVGKMPLGSYELTFSPLCIALETRVQVGSIPSLFQMKSAHPLYNQNDPFLEKHQG